MNIRPLNDRVLVKRDAAEDTTPGGIIVPENLKEKQVRGTVVAVGPGRLNSDGVQDYWRQKNRIYNRSAWRGWWLS